MWNRIWGAIRDGFDRFIAPIRSTIETVIGAVDNLIAAIKRIKLPKISIPGIVARIPKFPGFAEGVTNFSGGPAMVGERGPELVDLPRGANVIPNNRMGGGDTYVFNFPNYLGDKRELREAINETRLEFGRRGN